MALTPWDCDCASKLRFLCAAALPRGEYLWLFRFVLDFGLIIFLPTQNESEDCMSKEDYVICLRKEMEAREEPPDRIEMCCAYAENLLSHGLPVLFDRRHVYGVLQLQRVKLDSYHTFTVSQTNKDRTVTAPSQPLKKRQQWILSEILSKVPVSACAHGFENGRSIKTNALPHVNNEYALCLDIKDFFPSIKKEAVITVFRALGYTTSASAALASICCFNDVLPQGAPTSPKLSNILFQELDTKLAELAAAENAVYSRYADDITFSASHSLETIFQKVKCLLSNAGFRLNETKTRFYGPAVPKVITGLIVQKGTIRVPKHFKRSLKQEIYFCKKFGVLTHLKNIGATRFINYREHLYGKAYYIHMIEANEGEVFLQKLDEIEWPSWI